LWAARVEARASGPIRIALINFRSGERHFSPAPTTFTSASSKRNVTDEQRKRLPWIPSGEAIHLPARPFVLHRTVYLTKNVVFSDVSVLWLSVTKRVNDSTRKSIHCGLSQRCSRKQMRRRLCRGIAKRARLSNSTDRTATKMLSMKSLLPTRLRFHRKSKIAGKVHQSRKCSEIGLVAPWGNRFRCSGPRLQPTMVAVLASISRPEFHGVLDRSREKQIYRVSQRYTSPINDTAIKA